MSTTTVRHTQAAQQAAEVRRHEQHQHPHHHGHHGAGHRGQFGGYVFRLGRAPAPPNPRRPAPLRRRPPHPPGAQAGMEHDAEHGMSLSTQLLPMSAEVEDERHAAGMDIDMMAGHDEQHEGSQEQQLRGRHRALQWRIGQQDRPAADARTMEPQLQAAGGAGAQALLQEPEAKVQGRPEDQARALVSALLAINTRAGEPGAPGAATLQLAAVRAYLQKGCEAGPLATLQRVKQALLEDRPSGAQQPGAAVPDESQQNRNLLLPLLLLNANRPRTETQNQQACDRMTLVCETGLKKAAPAA